ncbi:RDD family protein [Paenibacillus sp. NPDC058174]|uniref:RDD family protein n=1 Tax=Paenibacillus sp. NPDC058174 TaxID=3346366 RepID=UPI0036D8D05D
MSHDDANNGGQQWNGAQSTSGTPLSPPPYYFNQTPEPPMQTLSATYSSSIFFRRWGATVIDSILLLLILLSFYGVLGSYIRSDNLGAILLIVVAYPLLVFAYYILLEGLTGYTLGKMLLRIRVVNGEGGTPGFVKGLIRSSVRIIDTNPFLAGGLPAGITVLATRNKQRLGDMAAKTFVVKVRDLEPDKRGNNVVLAPVFTVIALIGLIGGVLGIVSLVKASNASDSNLISDFQSEYSDAMESEEQSTGDIEWTSRDAAFKVTTPSYWEESVMSEEGNGVNLSLVDFENNSLMVVSKNIEPGEIDSDLLSDYAEAFMDNLVIYDDTTIVEEPVALTVNGYDAQKFIIQIQIESYEYVYLVVVIQTETAVHQFIALSDVDKFEAVQFELENIIESFTETAYSL